ncbi:MAG: HAMP domain-containing histidine kinase [Alphaproteobacteria bacterium]|nr:HAMP domain-containing histidine kinase [Alphaproteobacteria bacterium]
MVSITPNGEARGWRRAGALWRSFATKLALLIAVLVTVPLVLYVQFRSADAERAALLQRSVQEEGRLIATSLAPILGEFRGETADEIGSRLAEIGGPDINVKLLFRPKTDAVNDAGGGVFYIAANPPVTSDYIERDRAELFETGIFNALPQTCIGGEPLARRYTNPDGAEEVLTSITPINLDNGCWIVVTSNASATFVGSSLGQPYWKTPEAQIVFAMYLLLVVLVVSLFADIWRNVRRFGAVARAIRVRRSDSPSFRARNHIPELDWVAEEFDRLVRVLNESADSIRQAAEENAHALKAPLAVISQSIEPLKTAVPGDNERARRAVMLIEHSVARLDATVSATRRMEQATAELIDPPREAVDLSALLIGMLRALRETMEAHHLHLEATIEDGLPVRGSEELFETVIDNLFENAISFAPANSKIAVSLSDAGGMAQLVVADQGPGVPESELERIFERYYSRRDEDQARDGANFGIGLWIVRRNIEAIGGSVTAQNREHGGLEVTVRVPIAEDPHTPD